MNASISKGLVIDPEWSYTNDGGHFAPDINAMEFARTAQFATKNFVTGKFGGSPGEWQNQENQFVEEIIRHLSEIPPEEQTVIIRLTDQFLARGLDIAEGIRRRIKNALIFGGGSVPIKLKKRGINIHEALEGDAGESPFAAFNLSPKQAALIYENRRKGQNWATGLAIDHNTGSIEGDPLVKPSEIDYSNTDEDKLLTSLEKSREQGAHLIYPVRMTLGCPWTQICAIPCTDITYRPSHHPTQMEHAQIQKQWESAARYRPEGIIFFDLSLAANPQLLQAIDGCMPDELRRLPKTCYANAADLNPNTKGGKTIPLLEKIGIRQVFVGFERHDSRKLNLLEGEAAQETANALKERGIQAIGSWIVGWPNETYKEAQKTVERAIELASHGFKPAPQALDTETLFHPLKNHLRANGSLDAPLTEVALRIWETVGKNFDFGHHTVETVIPGLLIAGIKPSQFPETRFGASAMSVREVARCVHQMLHLNGKEKLTVVSRKATPDQEKKGPTEKAIENFIQTNHASVVYDRYFIWHSGPLTVNQTQTAKRTTTREIENSIHAILGDGMEIEDVFEAIKIETPEGMHTGNFGIMNLKPFRSDTMESNDDVSDEIQYRGRTIPKRLLQEAIEAHTEEALFLSADIFTNEGEKVGLALRILIKTAQGEKRWINGTVRIHNSKYRGKGVQEALDRQGKKWAQRNGFSTITSDPVDAGVYTALKRFGFPSKKHAQEAAELQRRIEEHPDYLKGQNDLQKLMDILKQVSQPNFFKEQMRKRFKAFCMDYDVQPDTAIEKLETPEDFINLKGTKKFKITFTEAEGRIEKIEESTEGFELGKAAIMTYSYYFENRGEYAGFSAIMEL